MCIFSDYIFTLSLMLKPTANNFILIAPMCLSSHFTRVGAKAPVANIKCHRDAAKSCSSCSATRTLYSPARPCCCLHPPLPPALSSWATHPSLIPGIQKIQLLFENICRRLYYIWVRNAHWVCSFPFKILYGYQIPIQSKYFPSKRSKQNISIILNWWAE